MFAFIIFTESHRDPIKVTPKSEVQIHARLMHSPSHSMLWNFNTWPAQKTLGSVATTVKYHQSHGLKTALSKHLACLRYVHQ